MKIDFEKLVADIFKVFTTEMDAVRFICSGCINIQKLDKEQLLLLKAIPTAKVEGIGKNRMLVITEYKSHIFRSLMFSTLPTYIRHKLLSKVMDYIHAGLTKEQKNEILHICGSGFDFVSACVIIIDSMRSYVGVNVVPIVRPIKDDSFSEYYCSMLNLTLNGFFCSSVLQVGTVSHALFILFFGEREEKLIFVAQNREKIESLRDDFLATDEITEKEYVPVIEYLDSLL